MQTDIFKVLKQKHDVQRKLCKTLKQHLEADDMAAAKSCYPSLELELKAHAAAEERHLYVPVMQYDEGLDLSRHAIAEHHEMDELMERLNDGRISDKTWKTACGELIHEVLHHIKEEEEQFFGDAKKILDKQQQVRLGALYETEHETFEQNNA